MKSQALSAASRALVNGPARATSTPWLRGLRRRALLTGTGFAHPKTPKPPRASIAGTISVPDRVDMDEGVERQATGPLPPCHRQRPGPPPRGTPRAG